MSEKKSQYEQFHSGQWFDYGTPTDIACCDCGLIHRVAIDWKNKRIRLVERRRSTAARK